MGVVTPDPCAGVTGLLERFNCNNNSLKDALSRVGTSPFGPPPTPPPPPPPPPTTTKPYIPEPEPPLQPPISVRTEPPLPEPPMSVATGGVPSGPPLEVPGVSPEPPPPPPGPPRPDVASIDVKTTRIREVFGPPKPPPPPEPEPPLQPPITVQSGYVPPTSVATGVPTSQPPLPPPPTLPELPKCYSCAGKPTLVATAAAAAAQGCAEIPEDQCRPAVPSVDRYIPGNVINPLSMIPGGLDAGGGAVSAVSLMGRRLVYPVKNL